MDDIFTRQMHNYGISPLPEDTTVAMAYVPYQQWTDTYSPEQGLCSGTMFPELNKPFLGCGGNKR